MASSRVGAFRASPVRFVEVLPAGRCLSPFAACLLAGFVTAAPARGCALPGDAVTVQASKLDLDGTIYTVATQRVADVNDARSRLLVFDARCRPAWSETVDGDLSHFDVQTLGRTQLLHFVTMQVAGDGTGYVHHLLAVRARRLGLVLTPLKHTEKDGFYLGKLQASGDEGVVTWTADPSSESEADAHRFVVRRWIWSGGRFIGPKTRETGKKYASPDTVPSRADFVAEAIGLPFRDQTGDVRGRFRDLDRVEARVQAAYEARAAR